MKINIVIFDMNNMNIEVQDYLESNEFFKEELSLISSLNQNNNFLSLLGVEINGLKFKINDKNKFVRYIITKYFEGYEIIDTNGLEVGHPDFILKKEGNEIYLELKIGGDTLRQSQLKWFSENKDKNNKLIFIDWEDDYSNKIVKDKNFL